MSDDVTELKLTKGKIRCWRDPSMLGRWRITIEQRCQSRIEVFYHSVDLTLSQLDAIHTFAHQQAEKQKDTEA